MNTTTENPLPPIADLVAQQLKSMREALLDEMNLCDKAAAIMERMPREAVECCHITCKTLMVYHADRTLTLAIIGALGAGRWTKKINPLSPDRINYSTTVDGVPVQIYATAPPKSCRIVEEEVEVPAHIEKKRTLVCS